MQTERDYDEFQEAMIEQAWADAIEREQDEDFRRDRDYGDETVEPA
jgi:hypothetical protein